MIKKYNRLLGSKRDQGICTSKICKDRDHSNRCSCEACSNTQIRNSRMNPRNIRGAVSFSRDRGDQEEKQRKLDKKV